MRDAADENHSLHIQLDESRVSESEKPELMNKLQVAEQALRHLQQAVDDLQTQRQVNIMPISTEVLFIVLHLLLFYA